MTECGTLNCNCNLAAATRVRGGVRVADETKPLRRYAGQIYAFNADLQPMDSSGMGQDHLDDADVDAERHGPGALVCTFAAILDEFVTIEVPDLFFPEVALQRRECRRLSSRRGGFPTAHISAIGRSTRSPKLCRRVTDDRLGRSPGSTRVSAWRAHFWASSRREGRLARVAALPSDLDARSSTGGKLG